MTWADIFPNLLIGLREGLEAGLVVSMLLAAVRATGPAAPAANGPAADGGPGSDALWADVLGSGRPGGGRAGKRMSAAPIWLGVLGAVLASCGFAAIVTCSFSAGVLSSRAQEVAGGSFSVLAVVFVTAVIFWMRRTAAGLRTRLHGDAARSGVIGAGVIGAGALTVTAFAAVGREGLETTLFLWTAARTSGQTAGPLAGAAAGLAFAVLLCLLLYRGAVRMNLAVFFNRTALALIVIAAGVLAHGLGNLQDAGLLPGQHWIALDLTAPAHPGSLWVSVITGVTILSPKMTVLQAVAWIAYLAAAIAAFAKTGRSAQTSRPATAGPVTAASVTARAGTAGWWERLAARRPWAVAGALVALAALTAGATIAAFPAGSPAPISKVTVTRTGCAPDWTSATAGTQTFTVNNQSGLPGEINLDDASGDIVGEIESIGPGTSAQLTATLGSGDYVFKCYMGSQSGTASEPVRVSATGHAATASPLAVKPVTAGELAGPNRQYQAYAASQLADLARAVTRIQTDLRRNDLAAAKADWLTAQLDWERVGASYDSFGDLGLAVDGLPDGLPDGVSDKHFTGLHRLEYGLWHGQDTTTLLAVAAKLASNVTVVQRKLTSDDLAGDPANLPIRAHEILEDALRDHLSGIDDQGSGAALAQTYADLQVTRAVLGYLTSLINARQPGLPDVAEGQLDILSQSLLATRAAGRWEPLGAASRAERQQVDGALGALLETLAAVPDLLEVPPVH